MKKLLLTILAATAGFLPLAAQDWAPFRMGKTPYFQVGDSIYSLRLTDVEVVGNDSVFEFNPRAEEGLSTSIPGCNQIGGMGQWFKTDNNLFGSQMIKTGTGDYIFIFAEGDSFLLKPTAPLSQQWVFSGQTLLQAQVSSRIAGVVQGMPDSIAVISISNGDEISISKNYGLVSSRSFEAYRQGATSSPLFSLHSLENSGIGQPVSSPFFVFDYQPGDKFLYQFTHSYNNSMMAPCSTGFRTAEVLNRHESQGGDTIIYKLKKQSLKNYTGYCLDLPAGVHLSDFDTVDFVVTAAENPHLFSYSQEYRPFTDAANYFIEPFNISQHISQFNGRIETSFISVGQDTCAEFYFTPVPFGGPQLSYTAGLGLVNEYSYVFYPGSDSYNSFSETLIAYQKGSENYGTWQPLVLSAEKDLTEEPVQVYPNPFTNELTVKLPQQDNAEVTIYNLQGQKIRALQTNGEANLQLPDLPIGLYLLQVQQADKSYTTKVQKQ